MDKEEIVYCIVAGISLTAMLTGIFHWMLKQMLGV